MGWFSKKSDNSSSGSPSVPAKNDIMRVTYSASDGRLTQHDVAIDQNSPNKDFSVRHIIADRVDGGAVIHRIDKVGEENA